MPMHFIPEVWKILIPATSISKYFILELTQFVSSEVILRFCYTFGLQKNVIVSSSRKYYETVRYICGSDFYSYSCTKYSEYESTVIFPVNNFSIPEA